MISLGAAVVRAVIKAYTYRYRKNFASLSRSVVLKINLINLVAQKVFFKKFYLRRNA